MFDRRLVENFDWGFLAVVILICSVGLVVLYSALTAGQAGNTAAIHGLLKNRL